MTVAEAVAERDRVLTEVEIAKAEAIRRGLTVLEQWARTGRPFSANDVREALRDNGVTSASTGALFNAAIRAGLIRPVGRVTSNDPGTHAKPVAQYVGAHVSIPAPPAETVAVPVHRDTDGRFTAPADFPGAVPLFDIEATP